MSAACLRFLHDRRGMALPLALFTLVIAAVMITAVFYVARLEKRMGDNSIATVQAFEAAETGLAAMLSGAGSGGYPVATGGEVTLPTMSVGANSHAIVTLRRLNTSTYLIRSEGQFLVGGKVVTRRQVARLVRLEPPELDPFAAIASRLAVQVADSVRINGNDSIPPGWGAYCPSPGAAEPGIRDSVGTVNITSPCTLATCLAGNPPALTDAGISTNNFDQWGSLTFRDMAAMAEKTISGTVATLSPTTDAGPPVTCRTSDLTNWGEPRDPSSPCGGYFPIIYAPGNVTLTGGWGQGTLLVEGDLTINGPVNFFGAIMVKGSVQTTDGNLMGALTINGTTGTPTVIGGGARVTRSVCAINRAAAAAGKPTAFKDRSWAQLY